MILTIITAIHLQVHTCRSHASTLAVHVFCFPPNHNENPSILFEPVISSSKYILYIYYIVFNWIQKEFNSIFRILWFGSNLDWPAWPATADTLGQVLSSELHYCRVWTKIPVDYPVLERAIHHGNCETIMLDESKQHQVVLFEPTFLDENWWELMKIDENLRFPIHGTPNHPAVNASTRQGTPGKFLRAGLHRAKRLGRSGHWCGEREDQGASAGGMNWRLQWCYMICL